MLETTDNGADFSFQDRVFLCLALPDYRDLPAHPGKLGTDPLGDSER